jgi:hypothetical protein
MLTRRHLFALPLLAAGLGGRAVASEGGGEKASKTVGQYVDLQPVGLPVIVDGRLVNYVFVNVRLNLATGADNSRWRAKEPFFRDALVRLGYSSPFVVPGKYDRLDAAKLTASLNRAAVAITGPGVIRSVEVMSQTASHRALRRPS